MNVNNIFSTRMLRKYLSVFSTIAVSILLLILPVSAEDGEESGLMSGDMNFLGEKLHGAGLTFIDGDTYLQLQLQPDIPLGKIGVGLDLVLLYNPFSSDPEAKFLAEDGESWDNPSTWLRLIRYIRYGHPYDPFHFRFGELDYLTIGHGSIMSGYSNYDRRGLRLNFRNPENRWGVETMLNDFGDPTIFGGRAFLRPFLREENNNMITRFELGATYLTDINPNLQAEGEDPLIALGMDVGFPIIERSTFRLDLYNDFVLLNTAPETPEGVSEEPLEGAIEEAVEEAVEAELTEPEPTRRLESEPIGGEDVASTPTSLAWGNAVGIGFTWPKTLFKVEYRIFEEGYIPSVFDYTYESAKSLSPDSYQSQFLGLETTTNMERRRGFFAQLIWRPIPQINLFTTLEDYDNSSPKLYLGITETGLVSRLSLRAFYAKRDIGEEEETGFVADLFDLDEKSALNLEVRYVIIPPVETIILREYRFKRVETEEGIAQFEPIHKTSIMVGIKTDF